MTPRRQVTRFPPRFPMNTIFRLARQQTIRTSTGEIRQVRQNDDFRENVAQSRSYGREIEEPYRIGFALIETHIKSAGASPLRASSGFRTKT